MLTNKYNPNTFNSIFNYLFYKSKPSYKIGYNESYDKYRLLSGEWEEQNVFDLNKKYFFKDYIKNQYHLSIKNEDSIAIISLTDSNSKNQNNSIPLLSDTSLKQYAFTISSESYYKNNNISSIDTNNSIHIIFFSFDKNSNYKEINNTYDFLLTSKEISYISSIYNQIFNIRKSSQNIAIPQHDYRDIISGLLYNGFTFIFDISDPNALYNTIYKQYTKQLQKKIHFSLTMNEEDVLATINAEDFYSSFVCMCKNCVEHRRKIQEEIDSKTIIIARH